MDNTQEEKRVRQYRQCCAVIVRNIHAGLQLERDGSKLSFGLRRVSERLQFYTGLSTRTIYKLLNQPENTLDEGE